MALSDLLDLDTFVKVKKASPAVTIIPFDLGCLVVRAMVDYSKTIQPSIDPFSALYWQITLKELTLFVEHPDLISCNQVGRALKAMGLETWRKANGFHVAFSAAQLEILKAYFKA